MAPRTPFDKFRSRYSLRPPGRNPEPIERLRLTAKHGLRMLGSAPAPRDVSLGSPPSGRDNRGCNRYLWVIDSNGAPWILECRMPVLGGKMPKHTNLTGDGYAYIGGELWYRSRIDIYVSGGSGRYPPKDATQLDDAVCVFRGFGYDVTSLGWDKETERALRHLEGSP